MTQPILLDLPVPILTPRLLLRPAQPGDGAELNAAILESFAELQVWMPWADHRPSLEESEENVRRAHAKWILREDLRLHIFDRATGKLAGSTGLHRINWQMPAFEIGYWLRTGFVGKGYVTESTNAVTRYAFDQLEAKRVEIRCNAKNERSLAVFKRLGFEFEGQLRNHTTRLIDGVVETCDTLMYSRVDTAGLPALDVRWGG